MAGVEGVRLPARTEWIACRRCAVTHSLRADLRDKCRSDALRVRGCRVVLLNDPVAVSAEPHVTLIIDIAAMRAVRQVRGKAVTWPGLDQAGVAPPGYRIALGIVCDN